PVGCGTAGRVVKGYDAADSSGRGSSAGADAEAVRGPRLKRGRGRGRMGAVLERTPVLEHAGARRSQVRRWGGGRTNELAVPPVPARPPIVDGADGPPRHGDRGWLWSRPRPGQLRDLARVLHPAQVPAVRLGRPRVAAAAVRE